MIVKRIIILYNSSISEHSTVWSKPWIEYCNNHSVEYNFICCNSKHLMSKIKDFDVLLWHFSGYSQQDMLFARSIIYSAKAMGLSVFPDINDSWHFDDKIAETYLLQGINAPIPKVNIFFTFPSVSNWIKKDAAFPLVAKLRNGSGSHNVKLLKEPKEALEYSKTMFGSGFNSSPSLKSKTISNIQSSKSIKVFLSRVKRIPEFLRTLKKASEFPNEKGYVYFQEFIPNDGYDLKVVVVGDKLSFIGRYIRKGDFRASGGGSLFFDRSLITKNVIDSAFKTSDALGFKCMGYDYVVDKITGEGKIIEISYGFSHAALLEAGGYFDREGNWFDVPLNAPKELLKNLIND